MKIDDEYTIEDHQFRDDDMYALAKYHLTLRWLRRIGATGSLLNIGCGGGLFNDLATDAGFQVLGVEPDPDAYRLASSRAAGRYVVQQKGIFDLSSEHRADVVVMHDVLEHIDAENAAVQALAGLVEPDGVAIVSVPALESLFGFHDRQLGHFRRYTKTTFSRAMQPAFTVESLRYLGLTGVPVALWYSRLRQSPYPTAAATTSGPLAKAIALVCAAESRVPAPVGTSVVGLLRPSARSSDG